MKSTLEQACHGKQHKQIGGETVFTKSEENMFCKYVTATAKWRFPFSLLNLCLVVKSYWDRTGRTVTKFKENIPGEEWDLDLKLADAQAKTSNCQEQVCRKRNLSTTLRISKMVLMAFLHKTS